MGKPMRALGLMSGTSMDGIDVALIDSDGLFDVQPGPFASYPYSKEVRKQLRKGLVEAVSIEHRDQRPGRVGALEQYLTDLHGEAVAQFLEDFDISANSVDIIGFHGHTVVHRPEIGLTVQLGDGRRLAELSGMDVVFDMRAADCAAGGVGAPLAPVFHRAMASRQKRRVAFLNIGGVANVTVCDGGEGEKSDLIAFDTGPGNGLIDDWVFKHTGELFDEGGALCARGQVDSGILELLMANDYFSQTPPKALDRKSFDVSVVDGLRVEDGAATLCAFTAQSIARAMPFLGAPPQIWVALGGGRHNACLMERIGVSVAAPVIAAEAFSLEGDAIEAQAWAYMAIRSRYDLPITYPGTTGVLRPMTGGVFVKA